MWKSFSIALFLSLSARNVEESGEARRELCDYDFQQPLFFFPSFYFFFFFFFRRKSHRVLNETRRGAGVRSRS